MHRGRRPATDVTYKDRETTMTTKPNLFFRPDTILGACQGFADDLGVSPLFIRVPLASIILFSPKVALGLYAALCVAVLASRLLFPARKVEVAVAASVEAVPASVEAANEQRELVEAA
jgi:phage shock protein PspC (stress-responsive transcriptional regulator)